MANQRERFETLLQWTSDNLAGAQLGARLPAWHWGRRDDGSWGVKDENAAADADLWIAYTLLTARLWNAPRHEQRARRLLAQIARQEDADRIVAHDRVPHAKKQRGHTRPPGSRQARPCGEHDRALT